MVWQTRKECAMSAQTAEVLDVEVVEATEAVVEARKREEILAFEQEQEERLREVIRKKCEKEKIQVIPVNLIIMVVGPVSKRTKCPYDGAVKDPYNLISDSSAKEYGQQKRDFVKILIEDCAAEATTVPDWLFTELTDGLQDMLELVNEATAENPEKEYKDVEIVQTFKEANPEYENVVIKTMFKALNTARSRMSKAAEAPKKESNGKPSQEERNRQWKECLEAAEKVLNNWGDDTPRTDLVCTEIRETLKPNAPDWMVERAVMDLKHKRKEAQEAAKSAKAAENKNDLLDMVRQSQENDDLPGTGKNAGKKQRRPRKKQRRQGKGYTHPDRE
jgi:hypothetical protein